MSLPLLADMKNALMAWTLLVSTTALSTSQEVEKNDSLADADFDPIGRLPADAYVVLEGTIGDGLEVRMSLSRLISTDNEEAFVDGWYSYKSQLKPIQLWGHLQDQQMKLAESLSGPHPEEEQITGRFEGNWKNDFDSDTASVVFAGTWRSADGKRQLPFRLTERYAPGITAADYHRFAVRNERKRGAQTMSRSIDLTFPQFRGETVAIKRVNAFLRSVAADPERMGDSPVSAEQAAGKPNPFDIATAPSLVELEKRLSAPSGDDEELWFDGSNRWYFSDVFEIVHNEGSLASIRISHEEYTGGAHGNQWDHHFTLDLTTGQLVTLDELLKPGWEEPLRKLAEAQLRIDWDLTPDEPLSNGPLFENQFELNDNWYLSRGGIGFSFVPYEISAYVYGFIRVEVPKDQLTDWIADDSLLLRAVSR